MFLRLVRHEWRLLRADATVLAIAVVFGAAIGYATFNGVGWVAFERAAQRQAAEEEAQRYADMQTQMTELERTGKPVAPFGDPRNPTMFGSRFGPRYAILPPGSLSAVAIGQSDLLPSYFKVSTDARETIVAASEIENPHRLLAGRFDLAFVIIFLYPLLILAVTYNMLSAEKEEGVLALALSQPVSLWTLAASKAVTRICLLVGVVVAFSIIALIAIGIDLGASGAAVRLALWVFAVAAYGAFWFALALLVAAFGGSSATSATVLATIWLLLVVLLPSLFNLTATTLYPVPSRVEMIQAIRVASDEAANAGSQALGRYYEDHPELASGDAQQAMTDFNVLKVAVDDEVARRARPVVARYEQQLAAQQSMVDGVRFLSPAVLMQDALDDVAGTGVGRHRHFLAQVDRYHAAWRGFIVPLIFQKARITDAGQAPRFSYVEESPGAVVVRVTTTALGLLVPAAALAAFGARRLRRFSLVT
jgi:ABC-2 type transport system permease protein